MEIISRKFAIQREEAGLAFAIPGENADPLRALFFLGFGLFCFCAIFHVSTGIAFPKRLVFDDASGWLLAEVKGSRMEKAIPYLLGEKRLKQAFDPGPNIDPQFYLYAEKTAPQFYADLPPIPEAIRLK